MLFLDSVTNKTMEICNNQFKSFDGNYTKFMEFKKERLWSSVESLLSSTSWNQKQQEEIIERYEIFNEKRVYELQKVDKRL